MRLVLRHFVKIRIEYLSNRTRAVFVFQYVRRRPEMSIRVATNGRSFRFWSTFYFAQNLRLHPCTSLKYVSVVEETCDIHKNTHWEVWNKVTSILANAHSYISLVLCTVAFYFLLRRLKRTQMEKKWRHLSLVAVIRVEVGEEERMTSPVRTAYVFSFLPFTFTVTFI